MARLCLALVTPLFYLFGCSSNDRAPAPAGFGRGGMVARGGELAAGSGAGGLPASGGGNGPGGAPEGGLGSGAASGAGEGGEVVATGGERGSAGSDGGRDGFCGDGVVQADEACDPLGTSTFACSDFGFERGDIVCGDDCQLDARACSGSERCLDGRDNDGDGAIDCQDVEDCGATCNGGCSEPPVLSDPGEVWGSTVPARDEVDASCGTGGSEQIFRVVAARSGLFVARLETSERLTVSIRRACSESNTEVQCGSARAAAEVAEGEAVFVVIEGPAAASAASYRLTVESHEPGVCGDDIWDLGEACEDGNLDAGDGCDADCNVEATEAEVNDVLELANPLESVNYGEISENDVDLFELSVAAPHTSLRATIYSLGARGCSERLTDPYLELTDQGGSVIAKDDDGGDGTCPELAVFGLDVGRYFVRVRRSPDPDGERVAFPYALLQQTDVCGNGRLVPPEGCDDGNRVSGDGCAEDCRPE